MDPLSKEADYDPQSAAISSAYVSAFNDYVRKSLRYGQDKIFKPEIDIWKTWDFQHQPPGSDRPLQQATNTMPDLASAMKATIRNLESFWLADISIWRRRFTKVGTKCIT